MANRYDTTKPVADQLRAVRDDYLIATPDKQDTAYAVMTRAIEHLEALDKAIGDRDALRSAIGFKPGPLDEDRDRDIVIMEAKALRPAMVEARRAHQRVEQQLFSAYAYAEETIRVWANERFGKWITYKTAKTLRDRLFDHAPAKALGSADQ